MQAPQPLAEGMAVNGKGRAGKYKGEVCAPGAPWRALGEASAPHTAHITNDR